MKSFALLFALIAAVPSFAGAAAEPQVQPQSPNAAYVARRNRTLERANQLAERANQQNDLEVLEILQRVEEIIVTMTPPRLRPQDDPAYFTAVFNSADRTMNRCERILDGGN